MDVREEGGEIPGCMDICMVETRKPSPALLLPTFEAVQTNSTEHGRHFTRIQYSTDHDPTLGDTVNMIFLLASFQEGGREMAQLARTSGLLLPVSSTG